MQICLMAGCHFHNLVPFSNMNNEIKHDAAVVLEHSEVAPPPGLVPSTTLPLTFFDIQWLYCPPIQRIFFYAFPHPTHHFLQPALPTLKHSLSITLQHFFPFASNLIVPPQPNIAPFIRYANGDSLPFTVAELDSDFNHLISDSPQDVRNWHPLVPTLPSPRTEEDGTRVISLMAIQVTVLPNSGFSICLTFNHVAADGRSLHHFIKYWASVCKQTGDSASSPEVEGATLTLPFHDRDRVKDPKELKLIYLRELQDPPSVAPAGLVPDIFTKKVRSTLVLSREQVENLKKWITRKGVSYVSGTRHMSTFVVTCSLVWVCMIKLELSKGDDCVAKSFDALCYLLFPADCRDLPELALPSTYFGNCLTSCLVGMKRGDVVRENGIVDVANTIEREIRNCKSDPLRKAETWMSDVIGILKSDQSLLSVAGSPKLAVYETDFGWGKPKKSEAVHIGTGSISLSDCRDKEGGIEIGLALERVRLNDFINIFEQQFTKIACD